MIETERKKLTESQSQLKILNKSMTLNLSAKKEYSKYRDNRQGTNNVLAEIIVADNRLTDDFVLLLFFQLPQIFKI